jgi:hypothetical protein
LRASSTNSRSNPTALIEVARTPPWGKKSSYFQGVSASAYRPNFRARRKLFGSWPFDKGSDNFQPWESLGSRRGEEPLDWQIAFGSPSGALLC